MIGLLNGRRVYDSIKWVWIFIMPRTVVSMNRRIWALCIRIRSTFYITALTEIVDNRHLFLPLWPGFTPPLQIPYSLNGLGIFLRTCS